jgi:hypothetical protein
MTGREYISAKPDQQATCMPDKCWVDRGLDVLDFISVLFTNPRRWRGSRPSETRTFRIRILGTRLLHRLVSLGMGQAPLFGPFHQRSTFGWDSAQSHKPRPCCYFGGSSPPKTGASAQFAADCQDCQMSEGAAGLAPEQNLEAIKLSAAGRLDYLMQVDMHGPNLALAQALCLPVGHGADGRLGGRRQVRDAIPHLTATCRIGVPGRPIQVGAQCCDGRRGWDAEDAHVHNCPGPQRPQAKGLIDRPPWTTRPSSGGWPRRWPCASASNVAATPKCLEACRP